MNSLDLLNPKSSASSEKPARKSPTATHLEELCTKVCEAITERAWDDPVFSHFSPTFQGFVEHSETPVITSAEEYVKVYTAIAKAHPEYGSEVLSANADVDDKKGRATVWLLLRIFGHPKDMARESVTVAYLQRKAGKWWITKQIGMRGIQMVN